MKLGFEHLLADSAMSRVYLASISLSAVLNFSIPASAADLVLEIAVKDSEPSSLICAAAFTDLGPKRDVKGISDDTSNLAGILCLPESIPKMQFHIPLGRGTYIAAVFQDVNRNLRFDGVLREEHAWVGDPSPGGMQPGFDEIKFEILSDDVLFTVTLD